MSVKYLNILKHLFDPQLHFFLLISYNKLKILLIPDMNKTHFKPLQDSTWAFLKNISRQINLIRKDVERHLSSENWNPDQNTSLLSFPTATTFGLSP